MTEIVCEKVTFKRNTYKSENFLSIIDKQTTKLYKICDLYFVGKIYVIGNEFEVIGYDRHFVAYEIGSKTERYVIYQTF